MSHSPGNLVRNDSLWIGGGGGHGESSGHPSTQCRSTHSASQWRTISVAVHHPNSGHEKLRESRSRCLFQGRCWVRFPILPCRVTREGIWCDGAEILREISWILICRIGRNFPESGPKCSDITAPPPTHGTMYAFAHEGNYGPLQMIQVWDNSVKWAGELEKFRQL